MRTPRRRERRRAAVERGAARRVRARISRPRPRTRASAYVRDVGSARRARRRARPRDADARASSRDTSRRCTAAGCRAAALRGCCPRGVRSTASCSSAIARSRDDPCAGLKAPKSARRLPSALTPDEAAQAGRRSSATIRWRVRDRALFELAYSSGLRLAELAGLDCDRARPRRAARCASWARAARSASSRSARRRATALQAWLAGAHDAGRDRRAGDLRRPQRHAALGARHRAPARNAGDPAGARPARASAHAAAFVRVARAAVVGRPARGPGDARSRVDREHAGVHAPRLPVRSPRSTTPRIRAHARSDDRSSAGRRRPADAAAVADAARPRKLSSTFAGGRSFVPPFLRLLQSFSTVSYRKCVLRTRH